MQAEQWREIKNIFLDALEIDDAERESFISEKCAHRAEIKTEVEKLLAAHFAAEDFIERPAAEINSIFKSNGNRKSPRQFGNYKILREIGAGGMGAVFLATRADGEFAHQVAIKIIRQSVIENELTERFRRERQILASLNHQNIAKLLDGGIGEDGEPFLVMEYIEGKPLPEFSRNLDLKERLKLFLKICRAVSFAHRNLVIHRDLKPSNILVNDEGEPKLLDFGLAKMLDIETDTTQTATAFRTFTPAYASPEQMRGENVTTATDVYSLGVVLYELLSGTRPFDYQKKSLEQIIQTVNRKTPKKPSDVFSEKRETKTRAPEKPLSQISVVNPQSLKGDLDNIILKTLRVEPERRYKSVEAFAEDIERYLQNLPVKARAQTFGYRASKFIRRNRLKVVAASLILLTLLGGVVATLWQERQARREKAKAEKINAFLSQMLNYTNPVKKVSARNTPETTITEILDEITKQLDGEEFSDQPEIKAELKKIIADSYNSQGRYDLANKHYEDYVALLRQIYGETHPKTLEATAVEARSLFTKENFAEAEKIYRQVLPKLREEHRKRNVKTEVLADALNTFGYLRRTQGNSLEAETVFRETLALAPQIPEESYFLVGLTRSTLASTLADQGKFDEARQTARDAVEDYRRRGQIETPDAGFALTIYGGFLSENGEFPQADAALREAETIFRQRLYPTHLWLGDNLRNQGISFYLQNKFAESRVKIDEAQKIYLESFGSRYDHYPTVLIIKGLLLTKTGDAPEGEKLIREAVKLRADTLPPEHYWTALAKSALGECLTLKKDFGEAETLLRESLESLKISQGVDNPRTRLARRRLEIFYETAGNIKSPDTN